MLIDSHCHLDYLQREGEDLEAVVARAAEQSVAGMVTISTKLSEIETILGIAARFPNVWASVGVHPHEAEQEGQGTPDRLIALAEDPKVVAVGETGLDYFYEHSPREQQRQSFRAHIAAARATGLPVIVHSRDADGETVDILAEEYDKGAFTGVIHCFSGGPALSQGALDLGFYISMAGIVTFKKAEALRETVRQVPLERLLVETDSPYLAPVPHRGKRNEPAFVSHTAAALAEVKGVSTEVLAQTTTDNFFRLFNRATLSAPLSDQSAA
ncbi:MAG: TatD family hydrolase [Pseudomonadota bacterium]